jgi:hypothetical protein
MRPMRLGAEQKPAQRLKVCLTWARIVGKPEVTQFPITIVKTLALDRKRHGVARPARAQKPSAVALSITPFEGMPVRRTAMEFEL